MGGRMSFLLATLGVIVLGYAALCALLYLQQDNAIFYPVRNDPTLRERWQSRRVTIPSGDQQIEAWWADANSAHRAVLIYFGGNAEDVLYTAATARQLHINRMLVVNYRGYGESTGRPGESALFTDALAIYDYVVAEGTSPQDVVLMGRSLGSGVAMHVAAQRSVGGVVLVTPYDSMSAVGQGHYPYFPVRWLLKHRFESDRLAPRVRAPVLLLAAERDDIIPPVHARRLHDALTVFKELHVLNGAGHNDIEQHADYYTLLNGFLDRTLR